MIKPADIEALLPKIRSEALYFLGKYNKIGDLCTMEDTWDREGNVFTFPKITGADASDVDELGIGVESTQDYGISIDGIDATITKENVMRVFIPKITTLTKKSIISIVARIMALGEKKKLEYDFVSLFPTMDNSIGSATEGLTEAKILQGQIDVDDDREVGRIIMLSPYQYWDKTNGIASFTTQGNLDSGYIGEEIKRTGFISSGYGFDFIISKQIPITNPTGNANYVGGILSRSAIGIHTKKIADIALGVIEAKRGIEVVCTGRWKEVIIDQNECSALISKKA